MSKKYTFIGDCHGCFREYLGIIDSYERSVQLGDFGVGFSLKKDKEYFDHIGDRWKNHRVIFGNHDNRKKHSNMDANLGDYGIYDGMFFFSGAYSIDFSDRQEGIDWWPEEELTMYQCNKAIELYEATKPSIVFSHDCPEEVKGKTISDPWPIKTRTNQVLQAMYEIWKPSLWIYGHYHVSNVFMHKFTEFRCLNCMATYTLTI